MLRDELGVDARAIPCSCEASPATIDRDKLQLLFGLWCRSLEHGRTELRRRRSRGHGPTTTQLRCSARASRCCKKTSLTLAPGSDQCAENQSVASFLQSVSLDRLWCEEIFLYPIYVRQLTVWANATSAQAMPWTRRIGMGSSAFGLLLCRERDALLAAGYNQQSMRNFLFDPHLKLRQSIAAKRTE